MRRIRYCVAMSLDGFIAGPNGEFDWIPADPDFDFAALVAQFDTILVGRRTFEVMQRSGWTMPDIRTIVLSSTMRQEDHPDVTIVSADAEKTVAALRAEPGKDIWLFGGGELFRRLLAAGLVDRVEIAVIPILLGGGVPMLPAPAERAALRLEKHVASKSGTVLLEYGVGTSK